MDMHVTNTINYHTNQLKKSFRLNSHNTEDVRQDLILKVLEAEQAYDPESKAKLSTFLCTVIKNEAANIFNKLKNQPIMENHEDGGGIEGAGLCNYNIQRTAEIMDELNDANHPSKVETKKTKIKLTVISIGGELKHVLEAKPENDPVQQMSIQAILSELKPRQLRICKMLMAGKTQREIAKALGIASHTHVAKLVMRLQEKFCVL